MYADIKPIGFKCTCCGAVFSSDDPEDKQKLWDAHFNNECPNCKFTPWQYEDILPGTLSSRLPMDVTGEQTFPY